MTERTEDVLAPGPMPTEKAHGNLLADMQERVKELCCLYDVSHIIRSYEDIRQILEKTAERIPSGWRYPQTTSTRIVFRGEEFLSKPFNAEGAILSADIEVDNKVCGALQIYCTVPDSHGRDVPPFLAEERNLIDGLANMLGEAAGRLDAQANLKWERDLATTVAALADALADGTKQIQDIVALVLESAKEITHSPHGYVGAICPTTGDLLSHSLTAMRDECDLLAKTGIRFPVSPDGSYSGLWGHTLNTRRAFFTNDPSSHPASRGLPEGHVPLSRFLSVPALLGETVVGQISVCNSGRDYTSRDVIALERIARLYSLALRRRENEKLLQESRASFANIVQRSTTGFVVARKDGAIEFFNAAASGLLGKASGEDIEPALVAQLLTERPREHRAIGEDGRVCTSQLDVADTQWQGESAVLISLTDITPRKDAEDALALSEKFLQNVIDALPDGLMVVNPDHTVVMANQAVLGDRSGILPKNVLTCHQLSHGRERPCANVEEECPLKKAIACKSAIACEHKHRTPSGETIVTEVLAAPILDADGKVLHVIESIRDITDRKKIEARDQQRQRQLAQAQKLASLGTLVAGIAHEINNPNNVVLLNAETLSAVWRDALPLLDDLAKKHGEVFLANMPFSEVRADVEHLTDAISSSAKRIKGIIENLKGLARRDEGRPTERVEVNRVVKAAAVITKPILNKSTDRFRLDCGVEPLWIDGSFQQLEMVIINLLTNATQALESRTQAIELSTMKDETSSSVRIEVRDEGRGIPADSLARILEPFFTTRRADGGMGMGLFLCNDIVKRHGGKLQIASEPEGGTTVVIDLPLTAVSQRGE